MTKKLVKSRNIDTRKRLRGGFKKVWNFTHENRLAKCIKSPKYSFENNLFFSYGRGLKLGIFLSSRFKVLLNQRLFLGKLT